MVRRDLAGTTVLITGGGGGLGAALATESARRGARVAVADIDLARVERIAAGLEESAVALQCDVTDLDACHRMVAEVSDALGGPDVLINNAGITHRSAFVDTDVDVLRRVMDVNFFGAVSCTKAALPALRERHGAIAVVSSVAGFAPLLGRTGYAASKHALHGLFETLRTELRSDGVDVTIAAPTFIDTGFRDRTLDGDGSITDHPQSRVGRSLPADEVAATILDAIERRKPLVVIGAIGKLTRVMTRLAPGAYERLMARSLRSELERS